MMACSLALPLCVLPAPAREVPAGVRYKAAPDGLNASAKALLEGALRDAGKKPVDVLDETVTCGPMLWKDLEPSAGAVLRQSTPVEVFLQVPQVIHANARAITNVEQRQAFWLALLAKYPSLAGVEVRRASGDEIRYYWATVPFDIEEPFFAIVAGADTFVANFRVAGGRPVLFWLDRVGDLKTLGPALPEKGADAAALNAVTEMVRPAGWERYRFAYDGGLTLSVLMPQRPQEAESASQVPASPPIDLISHTLTANDRGMSFTAFYTSQFSREPERLSEAEKNGILAAVAGPWLNGWVKAMRQNGTQVEPIARPAKKIMIGDYPGVEQYVSIPPSRCRVRVVMVGRYSYGALVIWRTDASDDLPSTFLDSLRIDK